MPPQSSREDRFRNLPGDLQRHLLLVVGRQRRTRGGCLLGCDGDSVRGHEDTCPMHDTGQPGPLPACDRWFECKALEVQQLASGRHPCTCPGALAAMADITPAPASKQGETA